MAEPPCRLFLKNVLAQYTPADLEAELRQRGLGYGLLHIHPVRKGALVADKPSVFFSTFETWAQVHNAAVSLAGTYFLSKYPVVAEAARPRTDGAVYPVNLAPVAPAAPIVGSQAKSASGPPSWRGAAAGRGAAGRGAAGRGAAGRGAASPSGCGRRGPVDLVPPAPPPPPAPPAPPAPPGPPAPASPTLETEEMEEETVQRCTHDDYMVDPTEDADDSDDLPTTPETDAEAGTLLPLPVGPVMLEPALPSPSLQVQRSPASSAASDSRSARRRRTRPSRGRDRSRGRRRRRRS